MQTSKSIGAIAGIVALGFVGCARQLPTELDPAAIQQAETHYPDPPPPLKDATGSTGGTARDRPPI
jgi:hypothetical protein